MSVCGPTKQVLLEQPYIKDPSMNVDDFIKSYIATLGENIQVARFTRYNLGETTEKAEEEESLSDAVAATIAGAK